MRRRECLGFVGFQHGVQPFHKRVVGLHALQFVAASEVAVFGLPETVVGQRFVADVRPFGNHFTNTEDILFRIVEAGDHRGADEDGKVRKMFEHMVDVLEDKLVAHAGEPLVAFGIQTFDVEDQGVEGTAGLVEHLRKIVPAGFDGGVDVAAAGFAEQGQREFRLGQRLAPGQGHSAAGPGIEHAVLLHAPEDVVHAHGFAVDRLGTARTGPDAGVAARTLRTVETNHPVDDAHRAGRARLGAAPAHGGGQAARGIVGALRFTALRFRVAAPRAVQRAAFQEHQRTDAFAVVDAEFLYIKHDARPLPVQHDGYS